MKKESLLALIITLVALLISGKTFARDGGSLFADADSGFIKYEVPYSGDFFDEDNHIVVAAEASVSCFMGDMSVINIAPYVSFTHAWKKIIGFDEDGNQIYKTHSCSITRPVTTIYNFHQCYNLTTVIIPDGITTIADGCFYYCQRLEEITIPNSVTTIGAGAFSHCQRLEEITIPNSVTTIGAHAFYECPRLKEVTWNAKNCKLLNLEGGAIEARLSYLVIGEEVEAIGDYMFIDLVCWGDESFTVTCKAIIPPTIKKNCFNDDVYSFATLLVPAESLQAYREAEGWKEFLLIEAIDGEGGIQGDVDGDGTINISDVTSLIDYLLNSNVDAISLDNADCDKDGNINISDATSLVDYLLSGVW